VFGGRRTAKPAGSILRALVEQARLLVIDGSKGLYKALKTVFGRWGHIQRCQIHKMRNVQEHLPKSRWPWVRQRVRQAWLRFDSDKQAEKRLLDLAKSLEEEYPPEPRRRFANGSERPPPCCGWDYPPALQLPPQPLDGLLEACRLPQGPGDLAQPHRA